MIADQIRQRQRSPYGIRTSNSAQTPVKPVGSRPNWIQTLMNYRQVLTPNADELMRQRYIAQSNSAQLPRGTVTDTYYTKLQADYSGGRRSGDVTPASTNSGRAFTPPWPVGTPFGPPRSVRGRDIPRPGISPESVNQPLVMPRPAPYIQYHSASDRRRRDYVPVTGGRAPGLDYGPAPWRVPNLRKTGLSLMSGDQQFSTQQWASGIGYCLPVGPPAWSDRTRGTRSVSGILQRVQGPGREHVPATFVPREVR